MVVLGVKQVKSGFVKNHYPSLNGFGYQKFKPEISENNVQTVFWIRACFYKVGFWV